MVSSQGSATCIPIGGEPQEAAGAIILSLAAAVPAGAGLQDEGRGKEELRSHSEKRYGRLERDLLALGAFFRLEPRKNKSLGGRIHCKIWIV